MIDVNEFEPPTAGSPPPPPPPFDPPAPPPARWVRSSNRVIAGVAGGLADGLGLDRVLVRLGFVGLGVLTSAGLPAYAAGWLLMRPSPTAPSPSKARRVWGYIALGIAVLSLGADPGPGVGGGVFAACLLFGVAAALWGARSGRGSRPATWGPPSATSTMPTPAPTAASSEPTSVMATPVAAPADRPEARHRFRLGHSTFPVGRVVVPTAITAGALTWLFAGRDVSAIRLAFTVAAVILGVGVVAAMFLGRGIWLIVPGLLAVGGAYVADVVEWTGVQVVSATGDVDQLVIDPADLMPSYEHGAGRVTLDLTPLTGRASTAIRLGAGQVQIVVPEAARVTVHARVGFGTIRLPDGSTDGHRLERTTNFGPESGTRIELDLAVGAGEIVVERGPVTLVADRSLPPVVTPPPAVTVPAAIEVPPVVTAPSSPEPPVTTVGG